MKGAAVASEVAVALAHSADTVERHYWPTNPETAIRRQQMTVQSVDDTALVDEFVKNKYGKMNNNYKTNID